MAQSFMRSLGALAAVCGAILLVPAISQPTIAASAGLATVIGNGYGGHLPDALQNANAVADKLEASGFATVRLLGEPGEALASGLEQVRNAAAGAGPFRIVYMNGFGLCLGDDLILLAEDVQPEQYQSGQLGGVALPVSAFAEAVAGGDQTLIVFDTDPKQCTNDMLNGLKLPEKTALLVTTGIGGDVVEEVEGGNGAFATAFAREFSPEMMPKEIVDKVIEQIRILTEEQQAPILIGDL